MSKLPQNESQSSSTPTKSKKSKRNVQSFPSCIPLSPNSASLRGFRMLLLQRKKLTEKVAGSKLDKESFRNTPMYDALNKGLSKARGKYLTWLNADDLFYPGTLETVAIEMEKNKLDWVTGVSSIINADGRIVASGHPVHYFQSLIKKGWYRGDVAGFIQQEGTFFSKELYNKSPLRTDLEFAGDYALWCGFAEISELKTIKATLAMFRIHDAQKSQDIRAYFQECETLKNPRFRFLGKLIKVIGILSDAKLIKPL